MSIELYFIFIADGTPRALAGVTPHIYTPIDTHTPPYFYMCWTLTFTYISPTSNNRCFPLMGTLHSKVYPATCEDQIHSTSCIVWWSIPQNTHLCQHACYWLSVCDVLRTSSTRTNAKYAWVCACMDEWTWKLKIRTRSCVFSYTSLSLSSPRVYISVWEWRLCFQFSLSLSCTHATWEHILHTTINL